MRFGLPDLFSQDSLFGNGFLPELPLIPPPFAPTVAAEGTSVLYAPDGGSAARGGSGGGTSGSTTTTTTTTTSPGSLVINISWDASVQSAPSGFTTAVLAAVNWLESQIIDPITLNIAVGYGEVNGSALGSNALGASQTYLTSVSYSGLVNALTADATSATDSSVVASMPATAPVSGNLWVSAGEAKALGLAAANTTSTDGFVGFSSSLPFTYDNTGGVASGTYDFNGVALHELTEVMGRMLFTGGSLGSYTNNYMLMDLLHYSAAGVHDFSASTPGYFSADGGTTNLGTFNTVSGGDAGDWGSSMGNDAFNAFSNSGVVNAATAADLSVLDAIGWNLAGSSTASPTPSPTPSPAPSPTPVTAPTGVSFTGIAKGLAAAQTASGLAGGYVLAQAAQTGGTSGDSFTYTLGGANAASFAIATVNNAATLATGSAGLAGASGGALYALTVAAQDQTNGTSSPASPLAVIVGSGGSDTVSVASLLGGLGAATPAFVYGLAGNDSLNATGASGPLCLAGGAGADTLTGGSGANTYVYAATSDSTATSMDLITNFHAATDHINLTGLGASLKISGNLRNGKLGAHSVGWQSSGGNTYVYVNTGATSTTLAGASMKIALSGNIALTSSDFLHL